MKKEFRRSKDIFGSLPQELKILFDAFAASDDARVREVAERGFFCHSPERKRALFVGLREKWETELRMEMADSPVFETERHPREETKYRYYAHIAERIGLKNQWARLNLLFAKTVDEEAADLENSPRGLDFIARQLEISTDLIEALQPEIIIVTDPAAARYFLADPKRRSVRQWMGYVCDWDPRFAVHVVRHLHEDTLKRGEKVTGLAGIPVVFFDRSAPMGTFEQQRFFWQMRQVLEMYDLFFGSEYPGSSSSLVLAFAEMAENIGAWSNLKKKYLDLNEHEAAAGARKGLEAELDKIRAVLVRMRW